jgi:hypothetical protein
MHIDDTCAICQETFLAIIATQEMASVMETPGLPEEDMGVVQLPGCRHRFCRKECAHVCWCLFCALMEFDL